MAAVNRRKCAVAVRLLAFLRPRANIGGLSARPARAKDVAWSETKNTNHRRKRMKQGIHPEYMECVVRCSCGNTFTTRSTKPEIRVDLCNACHPFYTGQQKLIDSGGRVQRFADRFGSAKDTVAAREAAKKAEKAAKAAEKEAAKKAELVSTHRSQSKE